MFTPAVEVSRRDVIRLGGLLAAGWAYSGRREAAANELRQVASGARSCILVYLLGGPPHQDMWDLKPSAPAEIRGPFQPIHTSLPGVHICEHLPRLARLANKYAIIRSVSHPNNNHGAMMPYTLTGRQVERPELDNVVEPPLRVHPPHMGAVLAKCKGAPGALPGYVALPELATRSNGDNPRGVFVCRGERAGFLGARYDPLAINEDPRQPGSLPALVRPAEVPLERLERRQSLLAVLERSGPAASATRELATLQHTAVRMTGSPFGGNLYSVECEPVKVRERYGLHRFGQSMLLGRRLAEAGVPMVAIHFNYMSRCDGWDLHANNHTALRGELLPMLDQSLSALLEDLDQRGLLAETLVVCMGEFGRTPRINAAAGRDHWGYSSSTVLAGGGIRGGQVYGASDRIAAYPAADKVDPVDVQATIYHCMGLDLNTHLYDQQQRPWPLTAGQVITPLVS
jgi:hypothetical protein